MKTHNPPPNLFVPSSAPEDGEFTQTDIIIIAVTASVAGIVLIASIIYGCVKRQA